MSQVTPTSTLTQATPSNDNGPELTEVHREVLRERGIALDVARAAKLESRHASDLEYREWRKKHGEKHHEEIVELRGAPLFPVPGLFQPYPERGPSAERYWRMRYDTTTFRVRVDMGKDGLPDTEERDCPRYQCKGGVPVEPYIPALFRDPRFDVPKGSPFYITEAPLKCLALYSHGYPGIGLGGVLAGAHNTKALKKTREIVAHDLLARIKWKDRIAYTVFDAGQTSNPMVALGVAYLWRVLTKLGADVRTVTIPQNAGRDQGPDDYLVRFGKDAFQLLVDQAYKTDPFERVRSAADLTSVPDRDRTLLELTRDLVFRACLSVMDEAERTLIVKSSKRALTVRVLKNAVDEFRTQMASDVEERPEDAWRHGLLRTVTGVVRPVGQNVELCLQQDPELTGLLRFDEFSGVVTFARQPPWAADYPGCKTEPGTWWAAEDGTRLTHHLGRRHHVVDVPTPKVEQAVRTVSRDHSYHPVRQYLEGLVWDGTARLGTWLTTYFHCEATEHARLVGTWWLLQAVARVLEPGCKADYLLVLEGPQGRNKSQALGVLGGPWFSDGDLGDLKNKESALQLQAKWIIELGEGEVLSRVSARAMKAFCSRSFDDIVPKYSNAPQRLLRQCVFAVTINEDSDYLTDDTGNRRFWSIRCNAALIDLEGLKRSRDQLWAEAVARFKDGERRYPNPDEEQRLMAPEAKARLRQDPWVESVRGYLARRMASEYPDRVTAQQILSDIDPDTKHHTWSHSHRVNTILRQLGWLESKADRTKSARWWVPGPDNEVEPEGASVGVSGADESF